ncbi:Predicted ribosomal protein [Mycoplasma putrefaciens]|uniref:ribosomal-processing cysteine protease Prp n=1 Tax=Mycoplasma putrefaciens TaxID=2123 RepID=UPI000E29A67F|nr:ribosomal-processing cysteine protease Prp [Mycoplasma putrefaciens]SYV96211.1 Predicted ribosomal protein [Mycoplasma putrefaciens]
MVKIIIKYKGDKIEQFDVSGHANAGSYGHDLVCAAISGIVSGALNALDINYHKKVSLKVLDNQILIIAKDLNDSYLQTMLNMLKIQLHTITMQYPKNTQFKEVN